MRRTTRWCAVAAAMALAIAPTTTAFAATAATSSTSKAATASEKSAATPGKSDVREPGVDLNDGKALPLAKSMTQAQARRGFAAAAQDATVGTVATWPALNDYTGTVYLKNYVLKGIGDHIEIWVASDADGNEALEFPDGDCRNTMGGGAAVTVTQAQVDNFITEFDNNMFPKESEAFSVAPDRDGTNGPYGQDGAGDKTVTLVDNVRDANYYEPATPDGQTYIAGFFSSQFNDLTDRNVMTIDSFDWLHRTGANPPDNTGDADYAACATALGGSKPFGSPRPHLYEGTFAHEYQHLLESYVDPDEVNWVNEGLSDWAQTLVGYVDTNKLGTDPTADSHVGCFQGFIGENFGGPENSLTEWGDQGAPEILCDYGAAYTMMEYLHGRFGGDKFMSALHKEPGNGLVGLQNVLDDFGYSANAQDVVHNWLAMTALDYQLDQGARLHQSGGKAGPPAPPAKPGKGDKAPKPPKGHGPKPPKGDDASIFQTPTLKSVVNWASPQAYSTPGAPPNGADFVRLRDADGYLSSSEIDNITFSGSPSYKTTPVEWTVDGGRLYSGAGDDLDRAITRQVTVPSSGDQTLSADLEWATEQGWDFAYVQVYDPAKKTWVSLSDKEGNTTSEHDPAAAANVVANLPGFTGPGALGDEKSGVKTETFDLSPWAGQKIDIAFRYITDAAQTGLGYWVDNVKVGGTLISDGTDLSSWKSLSEAHPTPVAGWTVQLVGYTTGGKDAYLYQMPLKKDANGNFVGNLRGPEVRKALGANSRVVSAIVTADDPTEMATTYPTYTLKANGRTQPGGS
jgi:immune inhibitor InhA-like protein